MIYVSDSEIEKLNITNKEAIEWVTKAFMTKSESDLPHKISQTFNDGNNFYNTMPAIIPSIDCFGVKVVSRYPKRKPSIKGELLLYSYSTGELLALIDATKITSLRTGAVANLALEIFAKREFESIALIGLGQTGTSFIDIFSSKSENKNKIYKLKKYKGDEIIIKNLLINKGIEKSRIVICNTNEELIRDSDVIVSAVTVSNELIGEDSWYKKGVTVIPIHTRGFQNCDLFFDKVFADDRDHVKDFGNFSKFKYFNEIDKVIKLIIHGRENDDQRILSYNIGIALHDVYFAKKIYDRINNQSQ